MNESENKVDENFLVSLDKTFRISIGELVAGIGFAFPVIISPHIDLIFVRFGNFFEGEILAFLEVFEVDRFRGGVEVVSVHGVVSFFVAVGVEGGDDVGVDVFHDVFPLCFVRL